MNQYTTEALEKILRDAFPKIDGFLTHKSEGDVKAQIISADKLTRVGICQSPDGDWEAWAYWSTKNGSREPTVISSWKKSPVLAISRLAELLTIRAKSLDILRNDQ